MPLQGKSMVHLQAMSTALEIHSCDEFISSAAVWNIHFIPENPNPGLGQRSFISIFIPLEGKEHLL